MSGIDKDKELARLTKDLADSFRRWDLLAMNGGSDPFWSDGVNMNLVRNHILYQKRALQELVENEPAEFSLFEVSYPDIYYRETPSEVPGDYMVKADEIRQRAKEQLALYEADPNFQYCLENHYVVFPKGETRATKEAGLSIWKTCGLRRYREAVEDDDLIAMRRDFHEPYEEKAVRWAEGAKAMRGFLEMDHSLRDDTPVPSDYEMDDECPDDDCENEDTFEEEVSDRVPLEAQISGARAQLAPKEKIAQKERIPEPRAEQLSLF